MPLFLLLLSTFFLGGCTLKKEQSPAPTPSAKVGAKTPRATTKDECVTGCVMLWKGSKANDSKPEDEMNAYCDSLCESGQGMQNQDPEACGRATGSYRDTCYSDIAKKSNNADLCDKVVTESFAASCYKTIAGSTGNKDLCNKIKTTRIKEACLAK